MKLKKGEEYLWSNGKGYYFKIIEITEVRVRVKVFDQEDNRFLFKDSFSLPYFEREFSIKTKPYPKIEENYDV